MEWIGSHPAAVLAALAVLACVSVYLAASLKGSRRHEDALNRECDRLEQALAEAREATSRAVEHGQAVEREYREAQLQLARMQAAQHEREQAWEAMKLELQGSQDRLKEAFQMLASQVMQERENHFRASSSDAMLGLLQPFREQLKAFQERVNQVHDESLRGQALLTGEVHRLSEVGLQMSREAEMLARALKGDKKLAGNWGELQLERSLQMAGLERGVHYEAQPRFRDANGEVRMPDFTLNLPDGKHVVIDSKVSLVDYDRACSAPDGATRKASLDAHVRAVRQHIDDLSSKDYSALPGMDSPSFVLMFMPVEAAYIDALRHSHELFDYGMSRNVVLVSHSTLMPVLRTVSNVWMMARSNEQAQALADRAGELYNQVALVAERLKKLGEALGTVSRHYNQTVTAVAGQQGLHGKVSRFRELSARANRKMPDLQPFSSDIESERLDLIESESK